MTEAHALAIEQRWGAPGPAPNPTWRCCWRCGEWQPAEARFWCMPHRLCRACKNDEKRGIWPRSRPWHRKNRWDATGRLERRCCTCRRWAPLTSYYRIGKYDKPNRSARDYPAAECRRCTAERSTRGLTIAEMRRAAA